MFTSSDVISLGTCTVRPFDHLLYTACMHYQPALWILHDRDPVVIDPPFKEISLELSLFSLLAIFIARLQDTAGEI